MDQVSTLFEHTQKREGDRLKFFGALAGFDLRKTSNEPKTTDSAPAEQSFQSDGAFFRDVGAYSHLSREAKQKLTEIMMGQHKGVMAKTPLGRS